MFTNRNVYVRNTEKRTRRDSIWTPDYLIDNLINKTCVFETGLEVLNDDDTSLICNNSR